MRASEPSREPLGLQSVDMVLVGLCTSKERQQTSECHQLKLHYNSREWLGAQEDARRCATTVCTLAIPGKTEDPLSTARWLSVIYQIRLNCYIEAPMGMGCPLEPPKMSEFATNPKINLFN